MTEELSDCETSAVRVVEREEAREECQFVKWIDVRQPR